MVSAEEKEMADIPHKNKPAALITAVTFQAGVNPPGGVWQDSDNGHTAGRAIYASQKESFYVFLIFNTLALSSSILVIVSLTYRFPFHFELWVSTVSMVITYGSAIFAITPNESIKFRHILIAAAGPFSVRFIVEVFKWCKGQISNSNVEPQLPSNVEEKREVANSSPSKKREWFWFRSFQYDKNRDTPSDARNGLLIVVALITAVTFQARVNPPGGVWQDNENGHMAGRAIYASHKQSFYVFLISNTLALSSAILVIISLTYRFPFHFENWVATISMIITYGSAIFAITPNESVKFLYILSAAGVPFLIRLVVEVFTRFKCKPSNNSSIN
ncbi:uncharacterized protein LOC132803800 [Ziziphus jujuba]|uniref:Uncharacterized protein LOC132803800 n=1 Tax=Ziziphus jujuba TaxID=326968 RepID=A0ABM4A9C6_ZIZJJ|nr:uncharacterized protein LOC132803800 [Ziziphus jujuba]